MNARIDVKVRAVRGGDSEAIATLYVPSELSYRRGELIAERTVTGDGEHDLEAIVSALEAMAREIRYDGECASDRAEIIEMALTWWSDFVVPKGQCENIHCLESVPDDEIAPCPSSGRLVCQECMDDVVAEIVRLEREAMLRELEYDRREQCGRDGEVVR